MRPLALLYVVVLASLICQGTAAGAYRPADQGALAAAHQPTNYSTAYGRTTHNLRSGVMPMIAGPLLRFGALMLTLGYRLAVEGQRQNGTQSGRSHKTLYKFHCPYLQSC